MRGPTLKLAVPILLAAVAAGTVAAGLTLDARGAVLGAPHPPFIMKWDPRAHPLLALTITLFAGGVVLGPRLTRRGVSPAAFGAAAFGLTLVLRLALAAGRGGTGSWARVFDVTRSGEAKNEYLAGLPALRYGPGFLLDRFAELVPSLPVHVAGHPPGLMLLVALGFDTPARLASLCIVAGALSAPLTYALARNLIGEAAARGAGLLMAFAPGVLQYAATSGDAVYLVLGLLAAWPLTAPGRRTRVAGALALAVGSLFAWSLLAVAPWAALVVLQRDGRRRALELIAACAAAVLAIHGTLAGATGFDPVGTLRATEEVYRLGVASTRPWSFWAFGSPVAFLLSLGLPIAWLAARGLGTGSAVAIAIFAVMLTASALGFTKAETERIWLFLAPFVCLAAAPVLGERQLTPVLALLAVQALVTEGLFGEPW